MISNVNPGSVVDFLDFVNGEIIESFHVTCFWMKLHVYVYLCFDVRHFEHNSISNVSNCLCVHLHYIVLSLNKNIQEQ